MSKRSQRAKNPFPKKGVHTHPKHGIHAVKLFYSGKDVVSYELSGHKCPGFMFNFDKALRKWAPTVNCCLPAGDRRFMYNNLDDAIDAMQAW